MKQLIPQSKIDEAATNATKNRFNLKGLITYGDIYEQGFRCGVQLALNEIHPLMVEFAEWCFDNVIDHDSKSYYIESTQYNVEYSLEQLFEEFIEFKNKQK